jgi:hypothetical protein
MWGVLEEMAVDIVHPRVAGIDVHKKVIWVAVRLPGMEPGERKVAVKSFKTFWRSLLKMAAWLTELGVTDAAMESTGVYWWPVYHALAQAGPIEVCVCNERPGAAGDHPPRPRGDRVQGLRHPAARMIKSPPLPASHPAPWRPSPLAPACQSHRAGPAWPAMAAQGSAGH